MPKISTGEDIEFHPALVKLAADGYPDVVALSGFIGPSSNEGCITLYRDLPGLSGVSRSGCPTSCMSRTSRNRLSLSERREYGCGKAPIWSFASRASGVWRQRCPPLSSLSRVQDG